MRVSVILSILVPTLLFASAYGKSIGQSKCCGDNFDGCCTDGAECCMIYNQSHRNYDIGCCGAGETCCNSNKCCGVNQTCCGSSCCSKECFFDSMCLSTLGLERNLFLGLAAGVIVIIIIIIVLVVSFSCKFCHSRSKKRKEGQGEEGGDIEMEGGKKKKKGDKKKRRKNEDSALIATDSQEDSSSHPTQTATKTFTSTFMSTASIIKQVSRNFTEDDKAAFIQNCQNIKPFICGIIKLYVYEKIDLDEYATLVSAAYASTIARPLSPANINTCIDIIANGYAALVEECGGNKDTMVPAGLEMLKVILRSSPCSTFDEALDVMRPVVVRAVDELGVDVSGDCECVIQYCVCASILNYNNQDSAPEAFVEEFKTWIEPICVDSCGRSCCTISDYADRQGKYEEIYSEAVALLFNLTKSLECEEKVVEIQPQSNGDDDDENKSFI